MLSKQYSVQAAETANAVLRVEFEEAEQAWQVCVRDVVWCGVCEGCVRDVLGMCEGCGVVWCV